MNYLHTFMFVIYYDHSLQKKANSFFNQYFSLQHGCVLKKIILFLNNLPKYYLN